MNELERAESNKVRALEKAKQRRRLKGSIRKFKNIQRLYGLNSYQQEKLNQLIELLNKKQDEK